ncbi:F-box only protein 25 [Collichthys lucidus]|uniref:F-box only protein 25 n=1 Tax=Collichthys lucidus TaxID=240159 RepID=A0A4U5UL66_COLLU|nr:F-box only protein 25 [Collichthys lucidus]
MIDSCGQLISAATLGSNTINTNVPSNQRAAGGGDEFLCPHCVYFRQYMQRVQRQKRRRIQQRRHFSRKSAIKTILLQRPDIVFKRSRCSEWQQPTLLKVHLTKMPFLGKDWRSPGWSWTKTEHGWKRDLFYGHELEDINREIDLKEILTDEFEQVHLDEMLNRSRETGRSGRESVDNNKCGKRLDQIELIGLCTNNKENLFAGDVCELATTKRKKDHYNNNTKSQFVFSDKWIYAQKGSTKERHGYCTLGEALNRLDFSSAIQDLRRFNYVAKLFQLIARTQLTSLSGAAQKNYFNMLEKIVQKVLEDQYNPRLVKDLLHDLSSTLYSLTIHVRTCVLVGNINIWLCRLETILKWQQQLNNLQIPKQMCNSGMSFDDLPLHMQNKILYKFSDAYDIINLGQVTPNLQLLSENRILWKKLCHFHFADKEFCRNLVLTKSDNVDWKLMYFTLKKHYPTKEQYGDTLHFCKHCSILFWKDCGHPCTANDPDSCLMPISPQHFIDLFKF